MSPIPFAPALAVLASLALAAPRPVASAVQDPAPNPAPAPKPDPEPEPAPERAGEFFQDHEFDAVLPIAKERKKLVMVYWWQEKNERCQQMEEITWKDPEVQAWVSSVAIPLSIQAERNLPVSQRWRINFYPTTTFHTADGTLVERMGGYLTPEAFLASAKALLYGRTPEGALERPSGDSAKDPMAWLAYGNFVFGKPELVDEAVQAYLWLLDHSEKHTPGFLDQHLDLVLKRVMYAARVNPRAEEFLATRRETLRTKARSGSATDAEVLRIPRFDYWLRQPERTIELYRELEGAGERQEHYRKVLFEDTMPELVRWQHYEDVRDGAGEIGGRMHTRYEAYAKRLAEARDSGTLDDTDVLAELNAMREDLHADTADYYETLLGLGAGEDADALATEYLKHFPTVDAYSELMRRAGRLDLRGVAARLAERAEASLSPSDPKKPRIARLLARIQSGQMLGRRDTDAVEVLSRAWREQQAQKRGETGSGDEEAGDGDGELGGGDGDGDGDGDGGDDGADVGGEGGDGGDELGGGDGS